MSMTNSYENEVLDNVLLDVATAMALFTADPTEAGTVTSEPVGNGYARLLISSKFSAAVGGSSSNTSEIVFPTATASWGTITHIGYMKSDVETTSDMMIVSELNEPVVMDGSITFTAAIGTITVTAD